MVDFGPRCRATSSTIGSATGSRTVRGRRPDVDPVRRVRLRPLAPGSPRPRGARRRVAGAVKVATSFVRAKGTPADGVVGPLVLDGSGGSVEGSVLLVDLTATTPAPDGYERLWRGPWPNLKPYADRGAKAVVFVVNDLVRSARGQLVTAHRAVSADPGAGPRPRHRSEPARAGRRPAQRAPDAPGAGEGDAGALDHGGAPGPQRRGGDRRHPQRRPELRGGERRRGARPPRAALRLAAAGQRLERTLVFAIWPGHMAGTLPEATGWVAANRDIVKRPSRPSRSSTSALPNGWTRPTGATAPRARTSSTSSR